MKRFSAVTKNLFFLTIALFLMNGCATNLSKPTAAPQPAKAKLGGFSAVEMKTVGISEQFGTSEANQKARRKIDEVLFREMATVFSGLKRVEEGSDFTKSNVRTLQITPHIKEIKFISGGARFMVGAMAGSSAVLMQVTMRDSETGEVIADPEFYRDANAYSGGWSIGATDNKMLEDIARDIVQYSSMNK